jgi:hypothetical protein
MECGGLAAAFTNKNPCHQRAAQAAVAFADLAGSFEF